MEYACQVYGSACKATVEKLDVVHNMAILLCKGAYRTSPVDGLYVDSGIPLLSFIREELGLRYMSRAINSKLNSSYTYLAQPSDKAPNKHSVPKPLEVRLKSIAREVGLLPQLVAEIKTHKFPPWCRPPLKICSVRGNKKACSHAQLRSGFLEHASEHSGSIAIYTDGSKISDGVECSVVLPYKTINKRLSYILYV